MSEISLEQLRVAIVANQNFEESELTEPRKALIEAGAKVVVISTKAGKIRGVKHDAKGQEVDVDLVLEQADPNDFDALVLPGGALNADSLRMEPKAQDFVRRMEHAKKPMAVICHAPWLLISAGLVKGRTLTSYHTIRDDVRNAGGKWVDEAVVNDRNWVTSRQPSDIPQFNERMLGLFAERKSLARGA